MSLLPPFSTLPGALSWWWEEFAIHWVKQGGNDLEKPNQAYSKITFLAGEVLEASSRWSALWGRIAMPLSSSGIPPEAVTAAVPRDGIVEWEDSWSDNLWPFSRTK